MERSKFGRLLDNIFLGLLIFLISATILVNYINNNFIRLTLSFILMLTFLIIISYYQNKKLRKLSIYNNEKKLVDKYNFALRCLSTNSQTTFFKNLLKDKNPKLSSNGIILENKVLLFNALQSDIINEDLVFLAYSKAKNMKNYKIEEVVILTNNTNEKINAFVENFKDIKINIFSKVEIYSMMKNFNTFPIITNEQIKTKSSLINTVFVKRQARGFIRCALLLYVASLFVPFTKYYIIVASICLLLASICLCTNKKENKNEYLSQKILLKPQ